MIKISVSLFLTWDKVQAFPETDRNAFLVERRAEIVVAGRLLGATDGRADVHRSGRSLLLDCIEVGVVGGRAGRVGAGVIGASTSMKC